MGIRRTIIRLKINFLKWHISRLDDDTRDRHENYITDLPIPRTLATLHLPHTRGTLVVRLGGQEQKEHAGIIMENSISLKVSRPIKLLLCH